MKDGAKTTGYLVGGITWPEKRLPTVIDMLAQAFATTFIQAASAALDIKLVPANLQKSLDALFTDITKREVNHSSYLSPAPATSMAGYSTRRRRNTLLTQLNGGKSAIMGLRYRNSGLLLIVANLLHAAAKQNPAVAPGW